MFSAFSVFFTELQARINNSVNIETSSKSPLTVFNLLGKVIYSDNQNSEITSIDVSDWDKGIYLVQVGITTKKLIID